jgi:hypothetical protein
MQIVGEKTFPKTIDGRVEECNQVLKTLELDLAFLRGTLEPKTVFEASHKKLKSDFWAYKKSNWVVEALERAVAVYYPLYENTDDKYDSIRLFLSKDTLSISGPFDHFSHYGTIAQEEPLKSGYQTLVRHICKGFKVKEVVYFSEWCYSTDDFDTYQELKAYLKEIPEKQVQELNQIWYGQEYHIEQIDS